MVMVVFFAKLIVSAFILSIGWLLASWYLIVGVCINSNIDMGEYFFCGEACLVVSLCLCF
jgi:hypothetical protein